MSIDDFCFDDKIKSFEDWVSLQDIEEININSLKLAFLAGYDKGRSCIDKYNYYQLDQK